MQKLLLLAGTAAAWNVNKNLKTSKKEVSKLSNLFEVHVRSQDLEGVERQAEALHIYENSMEENFEHAVEGLNQTELEALNTWMEQAQQHLETFSHCDSVNALVGFVDHWHISHENREVFATWQGKMEDTQAAWEQLADGTDRNMAHANNVTGSHGWTLEFNVSDDLWANFNQELDELKQYELDHIVDTKEIKRFRQLATNVRFSEAFRAVEHDLQDIAASDAVHTWVDKFDQLKHALIRVPRFRNTNLENIRNATFVSEILHMLDMTMAMLKSGDPEPVLDYLINGESDGNLQKEVTGVSGVEAEQEVRPSHDDYTPETPRAAPADVTATSTAKNTTSDDTKKGASGMIAAAATAVLAFAATQI